MTNELFKSIFSPRDKTPTYNRNMPQNGPSTYEVGASSHNFQFNTVKDVSNPTFEPRNSCIEGNRRPFIGPNRQTGNADYTNQISVSTQPLPNVGPYQPQQAIPRDQITDLIKEMCGPISRGFECQYIESLTLSG